MLKLRHHINVFAENIKLTSKIMYIRLKHIPFPAVLYINFEGYIRFGHNHFIFKFFLQHSMKSDIKAFYNMLQKYT